ncbi:hypothetical protein FQR65_LT01865 [Abscondita terminalis]|nr:hypothetical protein FQR65_LT01865 [Abscondita terminalis]
MDRFKSNLHSKPKNPSFLQNLISYVTQYCNTATIHGFKYIGEKGRFFVERLFWICTIIAICLMCTYLVNQRYYKWNTSPVIVSYETKETPIYKIPFPAVTVCSAIKIDPDYFNFTKSFFKKAKKIGLTQNEETLFDAMLLVCNLKKSFAKSFGIDNEIKRNFMDKDFYQEWFLRKCKRSYGITLTEEGFCYTFNMLHPKEILRDSNEVISLPKPDVKIHKWSFKHGYTPGVNLDNYPKRTYIAGISGGLLLDELFVNYSKLDYLCNEGVEGFKIALHHPSEFPNMDKRFRLPLNYISLVAVKPSMISVSEELKNYHPKTRGCYFADEKYLSLYKLYTQQNCVTECLSNFTLRNCKCVPFWIPSITMALILSSINCFIAGMTDTKICGPAKLECVKQSKLVYLSYDNRNQNDQCECLPACTSLSYDIEISQTKWNWADLNQLYVILNMTNVNYDPNISCYSRLLIYYKDLQFLTSRRYEVYGALDFFSNVGGLLGLFIGFSLISKIELLYFLTLRIICNVIRYGRKLWSGEPNLVNN